MPNDELIDLNNPRFGATEADRAAFVRKSRMRLVALTVAVFPVGLWALIWPEPRLVVVALLLLIPLLSVAVALHARPAIRVAESERRPRGLDLIIAIGAPSLVLVLIGARSTLIDQPPSAILFAGGAAIAAALAWLDPLLRRRWVTLFVLVSFGFCYVRGATVEANILLDHAEPTRKELTVREKRATGRAFVHHELVVSPWIDRGVDREITVSQTLHDTLAVGDRVCIDVHPGALGLRWYEVARC